MPLAKPDKPFAEFPLWAHPNGQWCRKIGGKPRYFGLWSDPQAALEKYKREYEYHRMGVEPPADCVTLANVLNSFDDDKRALLEAGKIVKRTYDEYVSVCDIIATLGKHRPIESISAADLQKLNHKLGIGKNGQPLSPFSHKRLLTFARMVFRFANEILDCNVKYLVPLKPPAQKLLRLHRAETGERMFTAAELRALLEKADTHLTAIIYLGINCGFGPHDCITLPAAKIKDGFHNYARPKTGVQRRCPLWPETQAAIEAIRDSEHVLNGRVWNRHIIARQFKALCESCEIDGEPLYKAGVTTPYSLRRTFETVAKNADVNQSVIDRIMGHESPTMDAVYNQKVFDKQLLRCVNFVREWLHGSITL
jgi:integrase